MTGENIDKEHIEKVKAVIKSKKVLCKDFEYMTGPEMLELNKSCK